MSKDYSQIMGIMPFIIPQRTLKESLPIFGEGQRVGKDISKQNFICTKITFKSIYEHIFFSSIKMRFGAYILF